VAAASAALGGFGLRYVRLDQPLAPRRGLAVEVAAERGRRRRARPDSLADESVAQQRLLATARAFVPTFPGQTLVLGADASVLLAGRGEAAAPDYDEGDLQRLGGARSLRGYAEGRFVGNAVGRALAEYRYALDPTSFAFAFLDVGFVNRPATPGAPAARALHPGYGLGLQYRTPLGLVSVSYALNPDEGPARGKVHVGLAFGL
jgi:outer membrane translocation and assembly module TamA